MKPLIVAAIVLILSCFCWGDPPKVVKASPDNGRTDIDPATTRELRIVFDQPMNPGGRSVVGGGEAFPKLIGKPRWEDARTFVWTMQLEPDHEYRLSINNYRFVNFKSATGESAQPYPISFQTKSAGAATRPATEPVSPLRVGTFDHRALVIAYYGSEFNERTLRELQARHQKAKAEGNQKLVAELEKQGAEKQDQAHKQFAGEAPLDNITTDLQSAWPEIATAAKVDVILLEPALYTRPGVELVDVTEAVVDRIHPNQRARESIHALKKGK